MVDYGRWNPRNSGKFNVIKLCSGEFREIVIKLSANECFDLGKIAHNYDVNIFYELSVVKDTYYNGLLVFELVTSKNECIARVTNFTERFIHKRHSNQANYIPIYLFDAIEKGFLCVNEEQNFKIVCNVPVEICLLACKVLQGDLRSDLRSDLERPSDLEYVYCEKVIDMEINQGKDKNTIKIEFPISSMLSGFYIYSPERFIENINITLDDQLFAYETCNEICIDNISKLSTFQLVSISEQDIIFDSTIFATFVEKAILEITFEPYKWKKEGISVIIGFMLYKKIDLNVVK